MFKRQEVKINWKGKEETVVLRELTFGEWAELQNLIYEYNTSLGAPVNVKFNYGKYMVELLKRSIEKAPFSKNEIPKLPKSLAMKLFKVAQELNPLEV